MLSLADLVAGNWYITINCVCGEKLILFADLTKGKGTLQGEFIITCPTCNMRASYAAEHYHYEPKVEPRLPLRHAS